MSPVDCIISTTCPDMPGALWLFIFFNAAATSSILIQSAGPSLTVASILWSRSFSSFISFSMYSFHESLIPFSSAIMLPDTPFSLTPLYPVFLSFLPSALLFEKFHFVAQGHLNHLHIPSVSFPFHVLFTLLVFFPCLCRFFFFSHFHTFSSFPLLLQQLPHSITMFPYACMGLLTIHMWRKLSTSPQFTCHLYILLSFTSGDQSKLTNYCHQQYTTN